MNLFKITMLTLFSLSITPAVFCYTHTVHNESEIAIQAELRYHGASAIACRTDRAIIQPNSSKKFNSKLCQLKKITVREAGENGTMIGSYNVANASKTIAANVGQGLLVAAGTASGISNNSPTDLLAATYVAGQIPKTNFKEAVAYGSTRWKVTPEKTLVATSGVTFYK